MIRRLTIASLEFRYVVLGIALALIAIGAWQVGRMPVDALPEFAPPIVEVQTEAIGLSAEEVELLITLGLEELLSGVPWLESTRSRSVTGLSTITLIFKRGTDIIKARQMVHERLVLDYKLPNVASPPVILQPVSTTNRFMMIAISSETVEPTELSLLTRWTIKPRLIGVPGVANVAIWGQRLRQMHIHINPERMRDARVVQDEIIAAAGDALWVSPLTFLKSSASASGGWIDNANQRLGVEHSMPIETPEDMAKVPITMEPELRFGRTLPIGDVAETTFSHAPMIGDAFVNGGNGLLLVLEKFPSTSVSDVTTGVEDAMREMARGLPGVKIDTTVFRLASYVDDATKNLGRALLIGAILMIVVAGGLMRSWRGAVVFGAAIALSLIGALLVLQLAGITLNTMILAGLVVALAVIVDDAIGDVGRFRRALAGRTADARPPVAAIVAVARESRPLALYSLLIVMLSVIPIFYMGGILGAFLEPFAIAYLAAVGVAMVVALLATPALALMLSGGRTVPAPASALAFSPLAPLRARYEHGIARIVAAPRIALAATAVLLIAGVVAWALLPASLLPTLREREVVVVWNTAPGTSHPETQRIGARIGRELQGLPGVRTVAGHIGRAVTGDQIVNVNEGQLWVSIDPNADYDKTVASIGETLDGYPGILHSLHTYLRNKVNDVLTGERATIVVRVYGPKRDVRMQKAEDLRKSIEDIPGLVDLRVQDEVAEPQVEVKVDLEAAGKADIKPGDVRRASATVFSGIVVGYLFKDQKIFEVVVWGAPEVRQSLANLRDVWIDKADRTRVRLSDVAHVNITSAPTVIRHERIAPYVDVVANVRGASLGAVAGTIDARLRTMQFPLEHRAELLGEYVERERAHRRAIGVVGAMLIGIFLLLQASARSWSLAAVGFLALPAALAGGVIAAALAGGSLSLGAMVGLLAVLAIAARNALLLIDHYRRIEAPAVGASGAMHAMHAMHAIEPQPPGADLAIRGAGERMGAIVSSAVVIVAGMLPMVLLGPIPGLEVAQPIAVVVTGGVIASTLITLLLIPPLYVRARARFGRAPALGLDEPPAVARPADG